MRTKILRLMGKWEVHSNCGQRLHELWTGSNVMAGAGLEGPWPEVSLGSVTTAVLPARVDKELDG